jgi:hypothetical protein
MEQRELEFVWNVYKGCQISAMAICDRHPPQLDCKGKTYWRRGQEKRLATLTDSERFETCVEAQNHAVSLAHKSCDENVIELIPSLSSP